MYIYIYIYTQLDEAGTCLSLASKDRRKDGRVCSCDALGRGTSQTELHSALYMLLYVDKGGW